MGFVVDKKVLGHVSPRTSVSLANLYSSNFSTITITYHPGWYNKPVSGRSTQSPTPLTKKNGTVKQCLKIFFDLANM
jgi:hypothetical protein